MIKRKGKLLMTWTIVLMMLLNTLMPIGEVQAADISSAVFTNLTTTINDGGTITNTKPIWVEGE